MIKIPRAWKWFGRPNEPASHGSQRSVRNGGLIQQKKTHLFLDQKFPKGTKLKLKKKPKHLGKHIFRPENVLEIVPPISKYPEDGISTTLRRVEREVVNVFNHSNSSHFLQTDDCVGDRFIFLQSMATEKKTKEIHSWKYCIFIVNLLSKSFDHWIAVPGVKVCFCIKPISAISSRKKETIYTHNSVGQDSRHVMDTVS